MARRAAWALLLCGAAGAAEPLTLGEAIERALAQSENGVSVHAVLRREEKVLAVVVAEGAKARRFVLDAVDGQLLRTEQVDIDYTAQVRLCKIPLRAAVATALKHRAGTPVEARILTVNDRSVSVSVKILGDEPIGVSVDGVTGEISRAPAYTAAFHVEPADWASAGRNPYFVLEPGYFLVLEGKGEKVTITVLDETKVVDGVTTRVVEEREEKEGKLVEVSRNFFAISKRTNDVYYFGEEVDVHRDGEVIGHDGSWLAGRDGASFGLMMPGTPLDGARYFQEIAPDVAMDRAVVHSLSMPCETPAGTFPSCLVIEESSAIEKGRSRKWYARGIGLVRDGDLLLTKHGRGK